jgi:tRNA uridine 5-carbamoylmethylation protein Kti12
MCKVINFFGGPGIGKSTTAAGLFYLMKRAGYKVELVTEFAKELTYENRTNILQEDQLFILAEQNRRMARLHGDVDYIITDSPLFLSIVYGRLFGNPNEALENVTLALIDKYENINIVLERNIKEHPYQQYGRDQDLEASENIDSKIESLLVEADFDFTIFTSPKDKVIYDVFEFIMQGNKLEDV